MFLCGWLELGKTGSVSMALLFRNPSSLEMDTSGASFGSGLARVTSAIISIIFRVCSVCLVCGRLPGDDV